MRTGNFSGIYFRPGSVVGKRADMTGQTTGVLAPGARCFCCFEEGAGAAGAPGALAVASCGCHCLTLFACAGCMWRLVAPLGEAGEVPRPAQMQCKVCLGRFSDAAVLMACRHAVDGALALAVGAAPGAAPGEAPSEAPSAVLGAVLGAAPSEAADAGSFAAPCLALGAAPSGT